MSTPIQKILGSFVHKVKGQGTPLQDWTGPQGSIRLRLPDFKNLKNCKQTKYQPTRYKMINKPQPEPAQVDTRKPKLNTK
jgi:hypothetical protein